MDTCIDAGITSDEKVRSYIENHSFYNSFLKSASDYKHIDKGFALATFLWETGNGKSELWLINNNPAGITCGKEYCIYQNQEEGFIAMFTLLDTYVNDYGLHTIDEIRSLWSETNDSSDLVIMWKQILGG